MTAFHERIYRAIFKAVHSGADPVRAAIAAMREPTEEIVNAVREIAAESFMESETAEELWHGLIDAVLAGKELKE